MAKKYVRKNYFVKKSFQGRYIFQFYALIAVGALLFTLFFALTTAETLTIIYDNYDLGVGSTPFILIKHLLASNWLLIIPIGFIVAILALFHTHKIAGPLYKFELVFEELSRGIIDPHVRLREKDDAQEVMEKIRQANQFLADKITEMRAISNSLEARTSNDSNPEKNELRADIEKLTIILNAFTIKE